MKHIIMQSSVKLLVIAMASVTLVACGGDGNSPLASYVPVYQNGIDVNSSLTVQNELNLRREKCGIGALMPKNELENAANNHNLYLTHLLSNSAVRVNNPHVEEKIVGAQQFSGIKNPYYKGETALDRIHANGYPIVNRGGVVNNIALSFRDSSQGIQIGNERVALGMLNGLLAAPYHQKSLMASQLTHGNVSVGTYVPYRKNAQTSRGYVLNMTAVFDSNAKLTQGLVTYPCEGITKTSTALYHESPNPLSGRNLSINPVGQPVLIKYPAAKNISVTNIKFLDTQRNMLLPTFELRQDNDPHKQIQSNEMFIIPLTDTITHNSCDRNQLKILGNSFTANNCGLYPNTRYQVSFDISVDGQVAKSHSFTFSTGDTNYG